MFQASSLWIREREAHEPELMHWEPRVFHIQMRRISWLALDMIKTAAAAGTAFQVWEEAGDHQWSELPIREDQLRWTRDFQNKILLYLTPLVLTATKDSSELL
jgi:hypothetical protein